MTKASDELADALVTRAFGDRIDKELRAELRALAREAEAMGAKKLADVIEHFQTDGPATFYRWMDAQGYGRARAEQIGKGE